ncbi:MAG: M61 family metallopeptidase [Planctomycetes bacterium]|nr:M61 family metallopeptidase [Planctomycetota bacterium]
MRYAIRLTERSRGWLDVELGLDARDLDRLGVPSTPAGSAGSEVELSMATWTPGSYLIREYSRHVAGVETPLGRGDGAWRRTAKNRWSIRCGPTRPDGEWWVRYRVYARDLSVRTSFATHDWVFWNHACLLLWPSAVPQCAASIRVELPDGWRLAAGGRVLSRGTDGWASFDVDSRAHAVDTPCLAAAWREWSYVQQGIDHRLLAVGLGDFDPPARFVDDLAACTTAAAEVFGGELPMRQYAFLALFGQSGRGGLEHSDSSVLQAPRNTFRNRADYEDFLGLVAHEYLHVWNVKRMRPAELWDHDLENETPTTLLWVAEGFTAYYDDLCCRRAGLISARRYLELLVRNIRSLRDNPGRFEQSLADSSYDAWIRLYRPDENTRNVTQNYYNNGAIAAFVLDATIRRISGGARTLDDACRRLYGCSYGQGRGYTETDVVASLSWAAGQDLAPVVKALVHGAFDPELDVALELFGLRLAEATESAVPSLGAELRKDSTELSSVRRDGAADRAGLRAGDELIAIGRHRARPDDWQALWAELAVAGERIELLVAREGLLHEVQVVAGAAIGRGERIESVELPSEAQLAHRESWLRSRSLEPGIVAPDGPASSR